MTHTSTEQPYMPHATLHPAQEECLKLQARVAELHARVQELEASQAQRVPQCGLLARIKKEIDHAVINDHRTTPAFGRLKGEPCVKVAHLEATIDGWHMEYGITQEKQG